MTVGSRREVPAFSLVELMIAVMILGLGMVMIAAAFPVGLAFHQESTDETNAGLCARSAISRLTMLRTHDGHQEFAQSDTGYEQAYGQMSVVECFLDQAAGSDEQVLYLFEASGGSPTHDQTTPGGAVLSAAGLGEDIDDWLPPDERAYEANDKFAYQIFYQRMPDPGTGQIGSSRTYLAYVVVQKDEDSVEGASFEDRFPPPSPKLAVSSVSGRTVILAGGYGVSPGAKLVDVQAGQWYGVNEVNGSEVTLTRAPEASLSSHKVRVVNNAVALFAAVVSKQHIP